MASLVLGAFESTDAARRAIAELEANDFKKGGFSVIAAEPLRTSAMAAGEKPGPGADVLADLLNQASHAPALRTDATNVVASGAVATMLGQVTDPGSEGIRGALERGGVSGPTAAQFERTLEGSGMILGMAAEDEPRTERAMKMLSENGATGVVSV